MKLLAVTTHPPPEPMGVDPAEVRLRALLAAPVLPTILRLALPTVAVLFVQTLVSVAETFFVSFLGMDALAGVTLVFPVLLLITTMSNGGIGGGVSSAVARALGAGRRLDALAAPKQQTPTRNKTRGPAISISGNLRVICTVAATQDRGTRQRN